MAQWNPETEPVGKNESIGRRLFDEPMLMGAQQQPSYGGLLITHFEETRGDRQVSLDRLGPTGVKRGVKHYLVPRAEYAGNKRRPAKTFNGWIVVPSSALQSGYNRQTFPVIASPICDGEDLDRNIYHAHVEIPSDPKIAALYLREIFVRKGKIERSDTGGSKTGFLVKMLCGLWVSIRGRIFR